MEPPERRSFGGGGGSGSPFCSALRGSKKDKKDLSKKTRRIAEPNSTAGKTGTHGMQKWDSVLFLLCYIPGTFEPLEADWKHSAAEVPCVKTKAPMTPNVDKGPTYPVAAPELVNFFSRHTWILCVK